MSEYISTPFGYLMPREKLHSIDNLGDIPEKLLLEIKNFDYIEQVKILKYYTTDKNWIYIKGFILQVIENKKNPKDWAIKEYLIPDVSLKDQLIKSVKEILHYSDGYFDFIIVPDYELWEYGGQESGAPVVFFPNANYLTPIPENAIFIRKPNIKKINKDDSPAVAFRRWIAQRAAIYLYSLNIINSFENYDVLNHIAPVNTWTEDAKIAFNGLLRERNEIGWKDNEIPGFVGPDEFYF